MTDDRDRVAELVSAPTLDQALESIPLSEEHEVFIGASSFKVKVRVLSDSDCKEVERDCQIYIGKDYAQRHGAKLGPGEVSQWLQTSWGVEAVESEYLFRMIWESLVYETGGGYARALSLTRLRAGATTDQIRFMEALVLAHRSKWDPDEWDREVFASMLDDAKKKPADSQLAYGLQSTSTSFYVLANMLTDSQITELLDSGSIESEPLPTSIPDLQSQSFVEVFLSDLEAATSEQRARLADLLKSESAPAEV